jgi:hypothetical protein
MPLLLDRHVPEHSRHLHRFVTEENLRDMIEVPRPDDGDVFAAAGTSQMTALERAIQVALMAEQSAQEFYGKLADSLKMGR